MERSTSMFIVPDVVPNTAVPETFVQLAFEGDVHPSIHLQGVHVPGDVLPVSQTLEPPNVFLARFDQQPHTYTLVLVDPDDPYPEERSFRTKCHWIVKDIPCTGTATASQGTTVLPYLPPHPQKGTKKHRYALLVFKQHDLELPELGGDRIIHLPTWTQTAQLSLHGWTFFRTEWANDGTVERVYEQHLSTNDVPVYMRPELVP
jgi:large subunit ribosomal protein L35